MLERATRLIISLLFAAALAIGPVQAHAHGEAGEHVKRFEEHIGDYEQDVDHLISQLGAIVKGYAPGQDVSEEVKALLHEWEEVRYHAAVETVATPLYAPIWQAISGFKDAVREGAPEPTVRRRQQALEAALWQGLGALKLAASQRAAGGERQGKQPAAGQAEAETGPEATLEAIIDDLDRAVAAYQDGNLEKARTLISETYLHRFEGLEGRLIEKDPELVVGLEEAFNARLPQLMEQGAPVAEVREQVAAMQSELEEAESLLLETQGDKGQVF